jgi:hypothetical protein
MKASQPFHFFPPLRLGTMRAWTNLTAGQQPIETWVSGAIVLHRSIDFDSVLSMAAKYELRDETLAARKQSIDTPEQLFCLEGSNHGAEIAKAAFLVRDGKLCAVELIVSGSLERLLSSVFEEYRQSVSDKMKAWKTTGGANTELAPARQ